MRSYEGSQIGNLCHWLAEEPLRLIALFEPHQTGKSTIVDQALRRIDSRKEQKNCEFTDLVRLSSTLIT